MFLNFKTVDIIKFTVEAVCTIGLYKVNFTEVLKYRCSEK